ncbi:Crp/Fnr family transcriptional regulator [bacterium]|nr:Crp/Fnr family transcriptional regulator [candidate division CSSED10-310 bacterium]
MESDKPKVSSGIGRRMLYRGGERIFSEGQPGREMYVVESGRIRIFLTTHDRELTLAILKRGDFFGEMALLEDLPRSASAAAAEETRLIAIAKDDFKFLIQEHPEIAMKVLGRFSGRLRDADNLITLLMLGDSAAQVISEIMKQVVTQTETDRHLPKEIVIPETIQNLAQTTGLDIDQISLIMRELDRIGIVTDTDEGIVVRKHRKLKTYLDYINWRERKQTPENGRA